MANPVLNIGLGMSPTLIGWAAGIPRIFDAVTDPLVGYISDNTKSRWGRRRPFIFVGAILVGVLFALLWVLLPTNASETTLFIYFLVGSLIFYGAYTVFATPWVALGYELTPDYNERTRLMGVQNTFAQIPFAISPWFLYIVQKKEWFGTIAQGGAILAIIIGVIVVCLGVLPAIFLRERLTHDIAVECEDDEADGAQDERGGRSALMHNLICFFQGFGTTLRFIPFLKLCAATFLVFNGFQLIGAFQQYVSIYYLCGGDTECGGYWTGWAGTVGIIATFPIIALVTFLATRYGKRKTLIGAVALSMVGFALKWVCYNPEIPWLIILPAPLMSFGMGALFTLMPAMVADVVDADELNTHERREGMYGSIFWWVVKLGLSAALIGGGILLDATGFDVALEGAQSDETLFLMRLADAFVPVIASGFAIWALLSFNITEERAREIRDELEARRGSLGDGSTANA